MSLVARKREDGFTLFEIMVTLVIVGIIMGLVIGGVGRSVDRRMKQTTAKLSSTIRYLYNKSALEGLYIRLVFDLDKRSYWVEATADPFVLLKEGDTEARSKKDEAAKSSEDKKEEATKGDSTKGDTIAQESADSNESEPQKLKVPQPKFGQVDSYLLKPTKLPSSILIKDIQVEHKFYPTDSGQESIYFFPSGYVELAVINLSDEKDEINYSLMTNPMNGHVTIEDAYRKLREE